MLVKCYFWEVPACGTSVHCLTHPPHFTGGTAGLVVCLFAKFEKWRQDRKAAKHEETVSSGAYLVSALVSCTYVSGLKRKTKK